MSIKLDEQTNNEAELQAIFTVNQLQQRDDVPADMKALAASVLPTIASICAQFEAARKGQGTDPTTLKATRDRYANQLAEVSQAAVVRVNGHLAGVVKAMTPAKVDPVLLAAYRARMLDSVGAGGELVTLYYEAAELQDTTSMQAIEQAPKWDKAFALSEDQKRRARRLCHGDAAKTAEAIEDVRFHVLALTQTVLNYLNGQKVTDPLDALLATR